MRSIIHFNLKLLTYLLCRNTVSPEANSLISFGNVHKEAINAIWERLNRIFSRPLRTCFLLENREKLNSEFTGDLPLAYDDFKDQTIFSGYSELSEYCKMYGKQKMNDPERVEFHSLGQRPEEKGNAEEMEAGESEGRTKVDLRAIWPQWFILMVHSCGVAPRPWNYTLSGCLENW
jgi:hypothetical protein